jgi:hypothetical protein
MIDRVDTTTDDRPTLLGTIIRGIYDGRSTQNVTCAKVGVLLDEVFAAIRPNEEPRENLHVNPRIIPPSPWVFLADTVLA